MAEPGDLVLIDFPFTNLASGKLRPALVVADAFDSDFLFARVTSQHKSGSTDVFLGDWQASGLRLPSWVQLSKLATISSANIYATLGTISVTDSARARQTLSNWLAAAWP